MKIVVSVPLLLALGLTTPTAFAEEIKSNKCAIDPDTGNAATCEFVDQEVESQVYFEYSLPESGKKRFSFDCNFQTKDSAKKSHTAFIGGGGNLSVDHRVSPISIAPNGHAVIYGDAKATDDNREAQLKFTQVTGRPSPGDAIVCTMATAQ